jgi:PAS domain S-box-containing protein
MIHDQTYPELEQRVQNLEKENEKLKGMEKELQRVHRKLTTHLENTPLGVIEYGKGYHVLGWSSVAEDIFGWSVEEVIDKTLDDLRFIHEDDRESVNESMARLFSLQEPHNIVLNRNYRKDGSVIYCEWYNSVLYDQEGKMESILSLVQNITERRQAEEALQVSEDFKASLLNNSPDAVMVLNPDRSIKYVNPALEKITGFSSSDIVGSVPPYPWWTEETMQKIRNDFEKGLRDGLRKVDELFQKKNGEKFWVEITSKPVKKNDSLQYYLVNWVDVTERKQAEESLRKTNERTKLFAYSVCHDLKNPAIAAYGLSKLLNKQYKDILDEKGKNYCDQILKSSEEIAALVERINIYIQTKEAPFTPERVKLNEIVQMVREEFASQLAIRQISWSEPNRAVEMYADRVAILRALRNLVDNSLKYGGDDLSHIEIGYEETDEFDIITARDDGVGMEEETCEKTFEVFKRDKTSSGIEGAGLGLAIVKEIAERHGGRVWVESGKPKGVTFHIALSKCLL